MIKYDLNRLAIKASKRAIISHISILIDLNRKVEKYRVFDPISYQASPCGSNLVDCNNAFSALASSMDDILGVIAQDGGLSQLVYQGKYITDLLSASI